MTTPVLRTQQKKNNQPENAENAEAAAENAKTEEAAAENTKQLLPVFSNGMEFFSDNNQFKAAVLPYDAVLDMVKAGKLDGFLINMKSRCPLPCGEERFKQVENFRAWKAEHAPDESPVENPNEGTAEPAAAEGEAEAAPADTPFVPIVNKKNEE